MDRRWQLVLDCLDCEKAPFSQCTLVNFRRRLIEQEWDRRLIERTVEVVAQRKIFSARALRAALDSSPWWGPRRRYLSPPGAGPAQGSGRPGVSAGAEADRDRGRGRG